MGTVQFEKTTLKKTKFFVEDAVGVSNEGNKTFTIAATDTSVEMYTGEVSGKASTATFRSYELYIDDTPNADAGYLLTSTEVVKRSARVAPIGALDFEGYDLLVTTEPPETIDKVDDFSITVKNVSGAELDIRLVVVGETAA